MLLFNATAAKAKANRYEQRLSKAELRFIMDSIRATAREGFNGIKWQGNLYERNIKILKSNGYKVTQGSCGTYEITW